MVLVAYSDSEGSDTEEAPKPTPKPPAATKQSASIPNFTIDKSNPSKIRVNLSSTISAEDRSREDDEPAAKRPRIGGRSGGAFSGFNAMLPAPKNDVKKPGTTSTNGVKPPARKVFSLKTGAEPAFSRESDAELRELFAEQEGEQVNTQGTSKMEDTRQSTIPTEIPKPRFPTEKSTSQAMNKPFLFKPLSVSRGPKKKKVASQIMKMNTMPGEQPTNTKHVETDTFLRTAAKIDEEPQPAPTAKPKMSLFSSGPTLLPNPDPDPDPDFEIMGEEDEIVEILDEDLTAANTTPQGSNPEPESLASIADSLNLTPAERRQLLGRHHNSSSTSNRDKIITFNTDAEYAANQALTAEAAAVQHNPVRAIGGGKHSLKSLVASAQGQKEALEESFAAGRRNKREAGNKYGW